MFIADSHELNIEKTFENQLASLKMEGYEFSNPEIENIKKYGTDCIRVDASGYPTGYISEAAGDLVRPALALSNYILPYNQRFHF